MNTIYSVVGNQPGKQPAVNSKSRQQRRNGNKSAAIAYTGKRALAAAVLAALLGLSTSPFVQAAPPAPPAPPAIGDSGATGTLTQVSGTGSNTNGAKVVNTCPYYVDRGNPGNNTVNGNGHMMDGACGVAVGNKAEVHDAAWAGVGGTGGGGVAIGDRADVISGVAIGSGAQAQNNSSISIGPISLTTGNSAIAIGRQSAGTGDYAVAMGNVSWAQGESAVAIGHSAHAKGYRSTAIGGDDVEHASSDGISAGANYDPSGQTFAGGKGATAIGSHAVAGGNGALAVGTDSVAGDGNTGASSNATIGTNAVAIGTKATASADSAVAVGNGANATGVHSIAMGVGSTVSGDGSGAFGDPNNVSGNGSYAFGNDNTINADNAFVLGNNVTIAAGLDGAVALGNNTTVSAPNTAYYNPGTGALSGTATSVVSIGSVGGERQIQNVAPGAKLTDAVNVSQLQALASVVNSSAHSVHYYSVNSTATGGGSNYANDGATGTNALAAGVGAQAQGIHATAVGESSNAKGSWSSAVGFKASATGTSATAFGEQANASASGATAIGGAAKAQGTSTTAVGTGANATAAAATALGAGANAASGATAVGRNANAGGINSTAVGINAQAGLSGAAFGFGAQASGNSSLALGLGAKATLNNSIAIGSGSITDAHHSGTYALGGASVAGSTASSTRVMSVGSAGKERQIQYVAPGVVSATSTDAINGSQLYATNQQVSTNTTNIANITGDITNNTTNISNVINGKAGPFQADNSSTSTQPVATGSDAVAGGFGTSATGNQSTVIGNNASDNGNKAATVLGEGASIASGISGSNVAIGQGSQVTTAAVANTGDTIRGTSYTYAGTAPAGVVSVGTAGNERQITNVAAGQINANSTDAVNGSQLYATNQAISTLSGTTSQPITFAGDTGTSVHRRLGQTINVKGDTNITTVGDAATHTLNVQLNKDLTNLNSVTVGGTRMDTSGVTITGGPSMTTSGIDAGGQQITNVAPGTQGTDAVNINQLNSAVQSSNDWAKSYTDQRFDELSNQANAGVAAAMAMASVPQAYAPNQSTFGVALGSFRGESAIAVGVSTISDNGHYILKLNATGNSRGDAGVGVGAAIVW